MPWYVSEGYFDRLAQIESGGNPNAQASTSSASGLYQFTKSTWERLGYAWKDRFNVTIQNKAIKELTEKNALGLSLNNLDVTDANLYAAHFLGVGDAVKVLKARASDSLANVLPSAVLNANDFLKGMSVGDFNKWLEDKVGEGGGVSGVVSGAANAIGDATGINSVLDWLKAFFSANTAGRFSAVFIGVILIGLAIAAFVLTSDKGAAS